MAERLRRDGDEARRVDASGQRERDGHVGAHAQRHARDESVAHSGGGVVGAHRRIRRDDRRPEAVLLATPVGMHHERGRRGQLADPDVEGRVVLVQRLVPVDDRTDDVVPLDRWAAPPERDQRTGLGREPQPVRVVQQEQRLLAEAVTRQHERVVAAVMEREGPHALEAVEAGDPVGEVGAQQHLGVGVGHEHVPVTLELRAQLAVVVELPVVGQRAAIELEGLVAATVEVDDAQPRVQEVDAAASERGAPHAVRVGTAAGETGERRADLGVLRAGRAGVPCDTAHVLPVRPESPRRPIRTPAGATIGP